MWWAFGGRSVGAWWALSGRLVGVQWALGGRVQTRRVRIHNAHNFVKATGHTNHMDCLTDWDQT